MVTHEARQACRYATPDDCQAAVLESDYTKVDVRIVNESATGFMVEVESVPTFRKTDTLRLRTVDNTERVRVVYMRTEGERIFIGMRRVTDSAGKGEPLWLRFPRSVCREMTGLLAHPVVCIACALLIVGLYMLLGPRPRW